MSQDESNKMYIHCSNCGSFFCYKCGAAIGGYEHFREGGCVLFDLSEIARWEAQFNDQIDAQFQRCTKLLFFCVVLYCVVVLLLLFLFCWEK